MADNATLIDRTKVLDPQMPAVILDLRGLITRSYHSGMDVNGLRDPETGERINSASHGAANFLDRILLPLLNDVAPINIVAVLDGGNDLRRAVYPGYKAKRKEKTDKDYSKAAQEQLRELSEGVSKLLAYLGVTLVKVPHREADDVIAALVRALGDRPKKVITVDHDLIQLVNEDTNTWVIAFDEPVFTFVHKFENAAEGKTYNEVEPGLVALYKSLVGDSTDEYNGVKGFGPGRWRELCSVFDRESLYDLDRMVSLGEFDELIELAQQNPNLKVLQMLVADRANWRIMYYLAALHPEACWGASGKQLIKPEWTKRIPDASRTCFWLNKLGVSDYWDALAKWCVTRTLVTTDNLGEIFEHMNDELEDTPAVGFDYESYDTLHHAPFQEAMKKGEYVDVISQKITGASFCYGSNLQHAVYLSVGHKDTKNVDPAYLPAVLDEIRDLQKPLVVQNAGFEMTLTELAFGSGHIVRPHDTRVMAAYYDENIMGLGRDGLKDMSNDLLRYQQTEYREVLEAAGAKDMSEVTGEQVLNYGADDAMVACHLWVLFRWALLLEDQWRWFLESHTAPSHIMEYAFRKGVNIDWEELTRLEAADKLLIEEGNKKVRSLLAEHCAEPNIEAAKAFIDSDIEALRYQLAEKWKKSKMGDGARPSPDRLDALVAEQLMKAISASAYQELVEVKPTYEFKGTAAQLRDVTAQLGFANPLKKDSVKAIGEWLVEVSADNPDLTEQQREFCSRLALAASEPKKRSGPAFTDLAEFCNAVIQPTLKSRWEGDELNYDSPQQMQYLLYCKLGLPVRRRSKPQRDSYRYEMGFQGSPGTDKKAINAALAEDCPPGDWRRDVLETIRDIKAAMTRFELFYVPYPLWKHPVDGAVHPGVKDPGTVTRRPTAGKPNILQVSKGPTRRMFIPHEQVTPQKPIDKVIASCGTWVEGAAPQILIKHLPKRLILAPDFSGQELRITGSEAQDPTLIEAYTGGKIYTDKYGVERREITDIHSLTTVKFLHRYVGREVGEAAVGALPLGDDGRVSYAWYSKVRKIELDQAEQLREMLAAPYSGDLKKLLKAMLDARGKMAKPTNFLITYLGTASTLAENTSMPEDFCELVMDEVFAAYGRLGPWQQETIEFARRHGYVTTAYGTRKHLSSDILSADRSLRSREERRACNQRIQGCAADILHRVETELYEREFLERYDSYFIAPVYDEIVLDVPLNDELPDLIDELAEIMDITPPGHAIPMMAEFSFGPNWADQFELGERPCAAQVEEALTKLFMPKEA